MLRALADAQLACNQGNPHRPQGRPKANSVEPAAIATYCLPSIAYVIGDAYTDAPHWKCHRILPVAASSAMKFPSASPVKTSPPAVESTPDHDGERCLTSHLIWLVAGSIARTAPQNGCASSLGKYALP